MLKTLALLVALGAVPMVADESEDDPHRLPPVDVPLVITEGTRVLAADADDGHDDVDDYAPRLFQRLEGQFPGRFTWNDADEHWVDAEGEYEWDEDEECYWQNVTAEALTTGRQDYVQFCASCHGFDGDGYGRSARHLRPPPRNFTEGLFKFTKVDSEKLPDDEALVELIMEGLNGTPMYPWDISENRIRGIVTYLKSLSNEEDELGWKDPTNQIDSIIDTPADPWVGREEEAVAVGEKSYHDRQCYSCHPGYGTAAQINEWRGVDADTEYPDTLTYPKLRENSSYEVQDYAVAIVSPDFTWHTVRRGADAKAIYRTIAAGVGGAGMPTWKGAMPDEEIWAISHYVRHMIDTYKDQPAKRAAFMASLRGE